MSGCIRWFTVWSGTRADEVFESKTRAKKHAAWLHFTYGFTTWWAKRVSVTCSDGSDISFDDYEFTRGDSRKIKK